MLCNYGYSSYAQTLTKYAKQRNQELAERKRMEKSNYEKACNIGTMAAYNEYLSMYPKGMYVQDVKRRISAIKLKEDQDYYELVCSKETVQAYQDYLRKYPNGQHALEARGRIEDMELWQKAKATNTIEAYRNYLDNSKNKSFAQLANDAITDLESKDSWEIIKHTTSRRDIEDFILKYPKSSCIPDATKRHDELLAVEAYEQGNLQRAYEKFEAAGGRYSIEPSNRVKFDECVEYVDFRRLNMSSKESDLLSFLKRYPSSKYYNQVSNMIAIEKAKNFSMYIYASPYQFDEALSYAKDETTRATVKKYINQVKNSHRTYERQRKARARKAWWKGRVKLGWNIFNCGVNLGGDNLVHIGSGLRLRLGNYSDKLNFILGLDYQYYYLNFKDYRVNNIGIHQGMGIANLRFNLAEVLMRSSFYLGCAGNFPFYTSGNHVKDEALNKTPISIEPQIGIQGKGWDFGLYYRYFVEKGGIFKDIDDENNNHMGLYITWYF